MHRTEDFDYNLPESAIAQFPPEQRGQSRLLVYDRGNIRHHNFPDILEYVQEGDLLIFNDTKVIPARLHFRRLSGAVVEVFLLEPVQPFAQVERAMQSQEAQVWECIVGNLKKWKDTEILELKTEQGLCLEARLIDRELRHVHLSWNGTYNFAQVLQEMGKIPLPPYISRELVHDDQSRYQTVYAQHEGAVAAPTAGLHFTEEILDSLRSKGVDTAYLSLHVGAGTFQPVKNNDIRSHEMHAESFSVHTDVLTKLQSARRVIATGTTSLRTLESLYWMGIKAHLNLEAPAELGQFEYELISHELTYSEAIAALLNKLKQLDRDIFEGRTSIMITPEYKIRSIDGLITNFHLPKSTLIMLVASWIGDAWRDVYTAALDNNYRFLSYGDSSLLFPRR